MDLKHGTSSRSSQRNSLRNSPGSSPRAVPERGFTLVELLVVIGIIALLISVLLPVLGKARAAANTTKCLANLRTIGQAMFLYASQNKGAIAGAPSNTGRALFVPGTLAPNPAFTSTFLPAGYPLEGWDFITPLARSMNLKLRTLDNQPVTAADNIPLPRFVEQSQVKYFQCPSVAGTLVQAFPAGSGPNIEVISYNTASLFLMLDSKQTGEGGIIRISSGTQYPQIPFGYAPKLNKIGTSATKIYAADGAKFTYAGAAQTYNMNPFAITSGTGGTQSKYSDFGAWTLLTGSYDRPTGARIDGRLASFRHGATNPKKDGQFRMNVVYFDGHGETIDDVAARNPSLWCPKGTMIQDMSKIPPDVAAKYDLKSGSIIQ